MIQLITLPVGRCFPASISYLQRITFVEYTHKGLFLTVHIGKCARVTSTTALDIWGENYTVGNPSLTKGLQLTSRYICFETELPTPGQHFHISEVSCGSSVHGKKRMRLENSSLCLLQQTNGASLLELPSFSLRLASLTLFREREQYFLHSTGLIATKLHSTWA